MPRSLLVGALPQRRQLFASIGLRRTILTALAQTSLDAHYLLAKTEWLAELESGDPVELSSTFMLRRHAGSLRIVVYLNHLDIVAAIKARHDANTTE